MRAKTSARMHATLSNVSETLHRMDGNSELVGMIDELKSRKETEYYDLLQRSDGGSGSGNWGHAGRPGHRGGSAPGGGKANRIIAPGGGYASAKSGNGNVGGGAHKVVDGKDISTTYNGDKDAKSVIRAQGFDGKPRVVGKEEFDKAVTESGFIAQRVYSGQDQETLKKSERQLYEGEFQIDTRFYASDHRRRHYGEGMYCTSSHTGKLTGANQAEVDYERRTAEGPTKTETLTLDPSAKTIALKNIEGKYYGWGSTPAPIIREAAGKQVWEKMAPKLESTLGKNVETAKKMLLTYTSHEEFKTALDTLYSAVKPRTVEKIRAEFEEGRSKLIEQMKNEESEKARSKCGETLGYKDIGAYAAALGYDAINAETWAGQPFTVVLNRSKVILLDTRGQYDAKD